MGIYIQDPDNPTADKTQLQELNLTLVDTTVIQPDLPTGCVIGQGLCTVRGTFEALVDLPLNFGGYHLYFQSCCRNLSITNIANPNGAGIGYYAFVPPPLINNSSPVFLGLPTPFLCVNDTGTFLNSAVDPDGDQLVFSFETPYSSFSITGGIISPPGILLTQVIPSVGYNTGFSATEPFGANGFSFINAVNGLTEYASPAQGNFVVALEVKEFRNGILIGVSRRDLQLQIITCPPNSTPALDVSTQQVAYSINAGDQLCFDAEFNDADANSIFLTAAGSIFDTSLFNPAATIQAPISGTGNLTSQFCWTPSCNQVRSQPYLFSLSVSDDGCPPKNLDVVYEISVDPFVGPNAITGPIEVCEGANAVMYSPSNFIDRISYQWRVNGGSINGANNDTVVLIDWGNSTSGTVSLITLSQFGCSGDTLILPVSINSLPIAAAGMDQTICPGDQSATIGGFPTGSSGSTYAWNPSNTLNDPIAANPVASPMIDQQYVVIVTNNGCSSTDTVVVSVSQLNANAGVDAWVCPGSTINLQATGGIDYSWSPGTSLSDSLIADPEATPLSTTTFVVTVADDKGCSDTDSVTVIASGVVDIDAGTNVTLCTGDSTLIGGFPSSTLATQFNWLPATSLSDSTAPNPLAFPNTTTTYLLTVSNDTCTNTDQVVVTIQGGAQADFTAQFEPRCDGIRVWFFNQSVGATEFLWDFGGGMTSTEENPTFLFPNRQSIVVTLTATDESGCTSSVTQTYSTYNFLDFVDIELPNVFSPNNDGTNDVFAPISNVILGPCAEFSVFNRWGSRIFTSTGGNISWSGFTFAGEPAVAGVYFYTLLVEGLEFNGSVTLMRE